MSRSTLRNNLSPRRLRWLLGVFFVALAAPIVALVWHGYGQLKWEAFHQYRTLAEELTKRIDADIIEMTKAAESRSFADYTFLTVAGDPSAKFLQRSPLSQYPVAGDLAGSLGYFQVGADGEFSSPLLPRSRAESIPLGIGEDEFEGRRQLANEIQEVLSDNRLIEYRPYRAEAGTSGGEKPDLAERESERGLNAQLAFDDLNKSRALEADDLVYADSDDSPAKSQSQRLNTQGRVADLKLDSAYEKKSAELEQRRMPASQIDQVSRRLSRKEKISVPEPAAPGSEESGLSQIGSVDLRIDTFESEIDPLEFSMLDSGHFVLFRRVWRDGERYTQGLVVDRQVFIDLTIEYPFRDTALSAMSDLVIAYKDDVLDTVSETSRDYFSSGAREHNGAFLYRSRLSAPLDALELIYTVRRLPPGPGAAVLGWVTLLLAIVFCGGFYVLYRTALKQIALARQQQDFVSAVSHELKTPLTSIRMYGEMLKEGWADAEKKQEYYEYIHDESERLGRLISNVLQLANLSHSEPNLDVKEVTVSELMRRMESKVADQVRRAEYTLAFSSEPGTEGASVEIDEDCFTQIVINLIDNAIKFSREASVKRIEISSRLTPDGRVVFSVRDYGPGIAKDQMKKIFDMFYRSESELTRETVGTGIGLAIVHQLCAAMGARVDVLNKHPGAEFQVSLAARSA